MMIARSVKQPEINLSGLSQQLAKIIELVSQHSRSLRVVLELVQNRTVAFLQVVAYIEGVCDEE